jgi:hypothetical protein
MFAFSSRRPPLPVPARVQHPQQHPGQAATRHAEAGGVLGLPEEGAGEGLPEAEVHQQAG